MRKSTQDHSDLAGERVVDLLDKDEYPSNIGRVAAVSERQILVIRRDWHELTHFSLDVLDLDECRAIEYAEQRAWYRLVLGNVSLAAGALLLLSLLFDAAPMSPERTAPAIIALIALSSFGVRLVTSTRRHLIRFDMPGEVLEWRSPAIDFKSKSAAAAAVREIAGERKLLR